MSGGTSSNDLPQDCLDFPRSPVLQYMEQYGDCIDGRQFSGKLLPSDVRQIHDVCTGCFRDTTAAVLIKQWCHHGDRGATHSLFQDTQVGSPYVPSFRGIGYERCLGDIFQ